LRLFHYLLKTPKREKDAMIAVGKLSLNLQTHELTINEKRYHLRFKLFHLITYMINKPNQLITRQELIEEVWKGNYYIGEKGLTHAICMLRTLIKKDPHYSLRIETIPKTGYQLRVFEDHKSTSCASKESHLTIDTSIPAWWPPANSEQDEKFNRDWKSLA